MASQIVVFDLDGTLVDSLSQIFTSCNEARKTMGLEELDEDVVKKSIGMSADLLFPELQGEEKKTKEALLAFRTILRDKSSGNNPLFDGVLETLSHFSSMNYALAIASNKPQELLEHVVENSALSHFGFFIRGSQGNDLKPLPVMPIDCMRVQGTDSGFMVGDRPEDMMAGRGAGLIPIGIALGAFSKLDLLESGAEMAFEDWRSFHAYLCLNSKSYED
jgi:phosphoglycolate phosphatase